MKVMTLRDAKAHLSAVLEEANTERVLITSNGEPAAVVIGVKGHDMEEVMLAQNPKFWAMIEESRKTDKTLTMAEVRARIANRAADEAKALAEAPKAGLRRAGRRQKSSDR
jgi:prevent-host-death family protein